MKFEFYSFWGGFHNHPLHKNFVDYFENLFGEFDYETVQIWSVFGNTPSSLNTDPKILTVQWSGESEYKDTNLYNINLIPKLPSKNIISYVFGAGDVYINDTINKLTQPRATPNKTMFCNFTFSNGSPVERKDFYLELSKYKKIDACGGVFKNWTGPPAPQFSSPAYHEFLSSWKFMICFEHSQFDYYMTEKITNAYIGGCIPIYWGCAQTKDIINEKAVLLLEENTPQAVEKLIERIKILDNDPELYLEMYNQPLFVDNKLSKEFTFEYIRENVRNSLKN
jgi:hypothetical protein